jgi:CxxC-x17-CxxC domain-containing protein
MSSLTESGLVKISANVDFDSKKEFFTVSVERQDKILTCKDCGDEFIFTIREQDFYLQKGFEHDPARCSSCRNARKRDRQVNTMGGGNNYGNHNMGNYGGGYNNNYGNGGGNYRNQGQSNRGGGNYSNGGGYGNGGGNYANRGGGGYGNGGGNGGFGYTGYNRPSGNYGNMGGGRGNMGMGGNNYGDQERRSYSIVCAECGQRAEVPFAPRQGVPVFCRTCYNNQKGR